MSVANRTRESGERVAKEFGIARVEDSWERIVRDDEIDAVVIGTWPYVHGVMTIAALENGKHVLCEARMAPNSKIAREMYQASLVYPTLVLQIVPAPHTLWVDPTMSRLIDEGYLGQIVSIDWQSNANEFADGPPTMSWRHSREFSGNNIRGMGIDYEALMRWVGPATRVTAVGRLFHPVGDQGGQLTVTSIPDHVDVIAEMACGAQLRYQTSAVAVRPESERIISGTDGSLKIVGQALYGMRRGDSAFMEIEIGESDRGGWRVEEEFIGAIRGEEEVKLTPPAVGVQYMEYTDAVTLSMQSGSTVSLPFVEPV